MAALCGFGDSGADDHQHSSTSRGAGFAHSASAADIARRTGKPLSRKVVVIGDGACGKSLLNVFVNGHFPENYEPTVFENHVKDMVIEDVPVELALWDTAGQESYDKLRSLSYADSHVIMVCFSVEQPTSLENVESKWIEEIDQLCPGVKLCLVALKCDLREDPTTRQKLAQSNEKPVEYEEGLAVARRIRASRYLECSARYDRGVREAFDEAARVAISARRKGETRGSVPNNEDVRDRKRDSLCIVS